MSRHLLIVAGLVALGGSSGCAPLPVHDAMAALDREELPIGVFCRVELPEQVVHEGVVTKASQRWVVIRPVGGERDFWVRRDRIERMTAIPDKTPREASDSSAVIVLAGEHVAVLTGCRGRWVPTKGISKDFGSLGDRIRVESAQAEDPAVEARVVGPREAVAKVDDDRQADYAWLLKHPPEANPPVMPDDRITVIVESTMAARPKGETKARGGQRTDAPPSHNGLPKPIPRSVTCRITEVRGDGTLVIEGRRQIQVGNTVEEVSLTGQLRGESVPPNRTVFSDDVAELRIEVRDTPDPAERTSRGSLFEWLGVNEPR